ncbi:hypothetical protein E4U43_006658 [Claviceps pusilla]|uniref:BTB domain-containing protein n=1 Tax=Claviceps pusilla TaxID=123648 RepID=A0A9P7SZL0_9HYPO|nr:hypothetical protein E4U43_006658 [Claviceps pusilla]
MWWKLRRRSSGRLLDMRSTIQIKVRGASISRDSNNSDHSLKPLSELSEHQQLKFQQLQHLIQRIRPTSSSSSQVDSAYKDFEKHRETCSNLCAGILQDDGLLSKPMFRTPESTARRNSYLDSPPSPRGTISDQRSSFSGRSISDLANDGINSHTGQLNQMYLNAIRDWKGCLEALCEAFRSSLGDTYKSYERDATPEMLDLLFASKKFRREAVHRMRNASVTRMLSPDPQFFPRYEIRFRNYERVKRELIEVRQLLQSGESGILPTREVQEFILSPRGDAVLEFANLGTGTSSCVDPVLRFRVSSSFLADTSPIFARMLSGSSSSSDAHEDEDIRPCLPPPASPYMCKDGTEVKLYRMPQYETNRLQSFEILMHAAHGHIGMVPNEVSFERFVAIADCCLRYEITSPLESVVGERWLPQWIMHRGAEDMADGFLVISYAFGLRDLFRSMSKSAILNMVDEKDLQAKPWPQKIKDKIWAIRCAKLDQIYSYCTSAIQEYLGQPAQHKATESERHPSCDAATSLQTLTCGQPLPPTSPMLSSSPRCPKGIHGCDAANLGWMLLHFNEMNLLQQILQPSVMSHMQGFEQPARSLAHTLELLSMMPSPVSPAHHGGVCDPSVSFRTAIADIYSSVNGLTLHDVNGKSHGWALSKHRLADRETMPAATGLSRRMAVGDDEAHAAVARFSDSIRLRILAEVDDPSDLKAVAQVNKGFFETYKTHQVRLMRKFLQMGYRIQRDCADNTLPHYSSVTEPKMRTEDFTEIRDQPARPVDAVSAISFLTIGDEEDDDDDADDYDDDLSGFYGPEMFLCGRLIRPDPQPDTGPSGHAAEGARSLDDAASPTSPRQGPVDMPAPAHMSTSQQSPAASTIHIEETPMTDEEARRILWPDSMTPESPRPIRIVSPGIDGHREKFLVGDPFFTHGLEDKTLVVAGDKRLRSERA